MVVTTPEPKEPKQFVFARLFPKILQISALAIVYTLILLLGAYYIYPTALPTEIIRLVATYPDHPWSTIATTVILYPVAVITATFGVLAYIRLKAAVLTRRIHELDEALNQDHLAFLARTGRRLPEDDNQ